MNPKRDDFAEEATYQTALRTAIKVAKQRHKPFYWREYPTPETQRLEKELADATGDKSILWPQFKVW